jgi:hypothetical protein
MAGTEPGFRRASDTRAIPEIPKASIESLRKITGPLAAPSKKYGPYIGPTRNLPLTTAQASQILDASGFPRGLEPYRKIFITEIVNESAKLPDTERRRFDILLDRAAHPCSKEPLTRNERPLGAYPALQERIGQLVEMEKESKQNGQTPVTTVAEFIPLKAQGIAKQLVDGFDVVSQNHFIFDKDGRVVDLTPAEKGRYSGICSAHLLRQSQQSQFTQFLKEQSDPFKGSQQGYGKTRKQKKKARKTLRRRKVRRNMH